MNPYIYVRQACEGGKSLLSLCCGIGAEFKRLTTTRVTAVDIVPEYLEKVNEIYPHVKTVLRDAVDYTAEQPDKSVDVISIIDGIEHLTKQEGLRLIKEMKRVAKQQIIIFTPDGYTKNEPHHAWDVPAGDEAQIHRSGWTRAELEGLGFKFLVSFKYTSAHGEKYRANVMRWKV